LTSSSEPLQQAQERRVPLRATVRMVLALLVAEVAELLQDSARQSFALVSTKAVVAEVAEASRARIYRSRQCSVVVLSVQYFSEGRQSTQMTTQQLWRSDQVDPDWSLFPTKQPTLPMSLSSSRSDQMLAEEQSTTRRRTCRTFVLHPGRYDYISGNSSF